MLYFRWMDTGEDDGELSRDLRVSEAPLVATQETIQEEEVKDGM